MEDTRKLFTIVIHPNITMSRGADFVVFNDNNGAQKIARKIINGSFFVLSHIAHKQPYTHNGQTTAKISWRP
jgi:hypothetical protein